MYPKIIWQGVANIAGDDRPVRIVQLNLEGDSVIERRVKTDAMGAGVWAECDPIGPYSVGDLVRTIISQIGLTEPQRQEVFEGSKIRLIQLVREATAVFAREIIDGAYGDGRAQLKSTSCLGLKAAKDLVEDWIKNSAGY